MLGPRNLRVSDEWYTRFKVSWDAAPSRVNGYKLVYQPEGENDSSLTISRSGVLVLSTTLSSRLQALMSPWRRMLET